MTPAGNAAYRLSSAMREGGIDSNVLNLSPCIIRDHSFIYKNWENNFILNGIDKVARKYRKCGYKKNTYFYTSQPLVGRNISRYVLVKEADVIYLHWVAGYFSFKNLNDLAKLGKPIFVFMHDMWPFTGGCHHSMGCLGYTKDCNHCKMFSFNNKSVSFQLQKKHQAYSSFSNIHFISPSKWMAECARNSKALEGKTVYNIPNIVDEKLFKPLDKAIVRKNLKLPLDKTIISFGCQAWQNNPYKGWDFLEKAINKINRDNILILIYGSGYNQETVDKVKYPITFMGRINDETRLAQICNAADLFVTPSLCENYSLVILENILCKTPVVGFNTTGIPELVITGNTGYLAKFKDVDDLANGIETLIDTKPTFDFCNGYSSRNIVNQHLELINKVSYGLQKKAEN